MSIARLRRPPKYQHSRNEPIRLVQDHPFNQGLVFFCFGDKEYVSGGAVQRLSNGSLPLPRVTGEIYGHANEVTVKNGPRIEYPAPQLLDLGQPTHFTVALRQRLTDTGDTSGFAHSLIVAPDLVWSFGTRFGSFINRISEAGPTFQAATGASGGSFDAKNIPLATIYSGRVFVDRLFRYDNGTLRYYENGQFVQQVTGYSQPDFTVDRQGLVILHDRLSGGEGVAGATSYVAMWSRALSEAEIQAFNADPYAVFEPVLGIPVRTAAAAGGTITGTGAGTIAAITGAGTGERTVTGTGAGTAPAATGAGTGERTVTGTGAGDAPAVTGTGTGERTVTGTGAGTAPAVTGAGSGSVEGTVTGTGAGDAPAVTGAGSGLRTITGTGAGDAPAATGAGTGERTVTGTGAGDAPAVTGAGSGTVGDVIVGTGAGTAPAATGAGTGERTVTGTGAGDAPAVTGAGSGTAVGTITGTGAGTIAAITTTGVALRVITGSGAGTTGAATTSATGTVSGAADGSRATLAPEDSKNRFVLAAGSGRNAS